MAGKEYGDNQGRTNAFRSLVGMLIPVDFVTLGEMGEDTDSFDTPDGGSHSAAEAKATDVPFTMMLDDPAAVQVVETQFQMGRRAAPGYKLPWLFTVLGPGDVPTRTTFVQKCWVKSFKRGALDRNGRAADMGSGVLSCQGIKHVAG